MIKTEWGQRATCFPLGLAAVFLDILRYVEAMQEFKESYSLWAIDIVQSHRDAYGAEVVEVVDLCFRNNDHVLIGPFQPGNVSLVIRLELDASLSGVERIIVQTHEETQIYTKDNLGELLLSRALT